jgi:hypothetical protein
MPRFPQSTNSISHYHQIPQILSIRNLVMQITHSLSFSQSGPVAVITSRIPAITNIKSFVNRKMASSTETKPTPFILKDLIFHETDTGDLYLSDGSITYLAKGSTKTETIKSKYIDAELNYIGVEVYNENPFRSANVKKKGMVVPAATVADSFHGILENGVTLFSANKIVSSPTQGDGLVVEFRSLTNGSILGFVSAVPIARRADNYEITLDCKTITSQLLIGFSSASLFPDPNGFVLGNADHGIVIGFNTSNPNFQIWTNDGSTGPVSFQYPIAGDSSMHRITIKMSSANITCSVDQYDIVVATKLPDANTDLYMLVYGIY